MKIAILSDIHDNVWNLKAALGHIQSAETLVCCGDLCSPFIIGLLADGFKDRPIYIVFGNNDGDLFRITQNASKHAHIHLHGAFFEGELGGKKFAVNHYPDIALAIAASGKYDVVCYGHNHDFKVDLEHRLLNPGTLMGYNPLKEGANKDVPATFVIYDTDTGEPLGYQVAAQDGTGTTQVTPYS